MAHFEVGKCYTSANGFDVIRVSKVEPLRIEFDSFGLDKLFYYKGILDDINLYDNYSIEICENDFNRVKDIFSNGNNEISKLWNNAQKQRCKTTNLLTEFGYVLYSKTFTNIVLTTDDSMKRMTCGFFEKYLNYKVFEGEKHILHVLFGWMSWADMMYRIPKQDALKMIKIAAFTESLLRTAIIPIKSQIEKTQT